MAPTVFLSEGTEESEKNLKELYDTTLAADQGHFPAQLYSLFLFITGKASRKI